MYYICTLLIYSKVIRSSAGGAGEGEADDDAGWSLGSHDSALALACSVRVMKASSKAPLRICNKHIVSMCVFFFFFFFKKKKKGKT